MIDINKLFKDLGGRLPLVSQLPAKIEQRGTVNVTALTAPVGHAGCGGSIVTYVDGERS